MLNLKDYRTEAKGLVDLLNYAVMIDDSTLLNKDGSLTSGFVYRAVDVSSATSSERNSIVEKMNFLLSKFTTGWAIHVDVCRVPIKYYVDERENNFTNVLNWLLDDERRTFFEKQGDLFESVFIITLTYMPPNKNFSKLEKMMYDDSSSVPISLSEKIISDFHNKINEFEVSSQNIVKIKKLCNYEVFDEYGQKHIKSPLLSHIKYCIDGTRLSLNLPPIAMYLDSYIGCDCWGGVIPRINDKYMMCVSIGGFPNESFPNMLDMLSNLGTDYRWNTRFVFMSLGDSLASMNKYRRKWNQALKGFKEALFGLPQSQVDGHAFNMVAEIDSALTVLNSNSTNFGYLNTNIILLNENRDNLEFNAKELVRLIENLGFTARIETINALEAWLGTLPSHVAPNIKRPLVSTYNLACFLPLSSVWVGEKHNSNPKYPPRSPALVYATSVGSTPFRLNCHVGDVGHTLIAGTSGGGKSTLLALLTSQFDKYRKARVFAFDKGNSLFALTHATGGIHYEIGSEHNKIVFSPLANIKSDSHQLWCENWVESCLELQGIAINSEHRKHIHDAMGIHRETNSKSLTEFISNLQDKELRSALSYYSLSGTMGHLVDGVDDGLDFSGFDVWLRTFEMEDLMAMGDKNALPIIDYIFYKIQTSLDGNPVFIPLDEAWLLLAHPVFKKKIREWLKVLRKDNAFVLLATQNLSDLANSGLLDVLQELCPTKIFLPNFEAFNKGTERVLGVYDLYKMFGLNDQQIKIIQDGVKKQDYYYYSELGTRLFQLELGDFAKKLVASNGKEVVAYIRELMNEYGDEWIYHYFNDIDMDLVENFKLSKRLIDEN